MAWIGNRDLWEVAPLAIYSCNLASVGKTTHATGTAGAHIRYIAREEASPVLQADHCPLNPVEARSWLDREERADRKNARVIDKIRIALPRELDGPQRATLLTDFMRSLTGGRIPWYAAIHQKGNDAHNPHAHIAVRDRDIDTGKRVLRLSDNSRDREKAGLEPKAVELVRERWEHFANRALEAAGHETRIDRRTLEAQGIDREPTIHIGPRAQLIDTTVQRPRSKIRKDGRGRVIDYPAIDQGRTRREFHAEIVDLNLERNVCSSDIAKSEWAKFEREQRAKDKTLEGELVSQARRRTIEERSVRQNHGARILRAREAWRGDRKAATLSLRKTFGPQATMLKSKHMQQRAALVEKESGLWQRLFRAVDFTGTARRKQQAMRQFLVAVQRQERRALKTSFEKAKETKFEAVKEQHKPVITGLFKERAGALRKLNIRHSFAEAAADQKLQEREAEREARRQVTERAIQLLQSRAKAQRAMPGPERHYDR